MIVEIIGTDGRVHYTRPHDHADVMEAMKTPGYSVRVADTGAPFTGEVASEAQASNRTNSNAKKRKK